jgi:transcriptional regulator with XRE-family HTH domain
MKTKRLERLKRKGYRDSFVSSHIDHGLAYQIKAIREQRGWTQLDLACKLELKSQSSIVRYEDPSYGKLSISKIKELASVFDVAIVVKFVPYSRFLSEIRDVSDSALRVRGFEEELSVLEEDCDSIDRYNIWGWQRQFEISPIDPDPQAMYINAEIDEMKDNEYVLER